jgi:molybdate transport system substrate-binding protein
MISNRLRTILAVFCALLAAACNAPSRPDQGEGPIVLAAASLQEAMTEAANDWTKAGHPAPALSFAGSSALARQAESGARADIFVSADEKWMDELERKGLVREGTRQTLLGNAIVVIAPRGHAVEISLEQPASLPAALGDGRLAMADPDAVPAGRYGKAALESLGIWRSVSARIAPAENVRAALALVERGQVPLGIVYATDALASDKVEVVARFPAASHPPIRYPAAVLKASNNADAAPFLAYLRSDDGRRVFARHGFTDPE